MKHHALVVGSPAFLRLWAVLGCEEKMFSEFMTAQELLLWGSEAHVDIVLYEEKLFDNFSSSQKAMFQKSTAPFWIPLPSVEGKGA
ncbi:MAG: hypothetical protein SOZ52_04855 [Pyramidobacter sp.]|nr:hypothetical protein [Pyramidobacter sp.]